MALIDHKIPILTGINDVPSTDGEANHPNDSLLCANYNALIDDIPTEVQTLARQAISATGDATYNSATGVINVTTSEGGVPLDYDLFISYPDPIYVNADTGNDETGDGTQTLPYATIQKAIDVLCESKIHYAEIKLEGTFINPKLDLSKYYTIFSSGYYNGSVPHEQWQNQTGLFIDKVSGTEPRIVIDSNYDPTTYNCSVPFSFIHCPNSVVFIQSLIFDFIGNDLISIFDSNIKFSYCTFNHVPANPSQTYFSSVLNCFKSDLFFAYCTFNYGDYAFQAINGYDCKLKLSNLTFNDSGLNNTNVVFSYSNITVDNFTGKFSGSKFNTFWIQLNSGQVLADLSISEEYNVVKNISFI